MRPVLLAVAITALALASGASAKGPPSAQVCGMDDCARLQDRQAVTTLLGGSGSQPPPTAAFYRLDVTFESPDGAVKRTHSYLYVPSTQLVAAEGRLGDVVWYPAYGAAIDMLERATRDLRPFPARAAWPTSFADPAFTPASPAKAPVTGYASHWTAWLLGAAFLLLTLTVGGLFVRRLRVRPPSTA